MTQATSTVILKLAQMDIRIELVWRDLKTGEVLSRPSRIEELPPDKPLVPVKQEKTIIQASAHFLPELGESQTTALNRGSLPRARRALRASMRRSSRCMRVG